MGVWSAGHRLLLRAVGLRRLEQPQLRHRGDHQPGGGAQQGLIVFSNLNVSESEGFGGNFRQKDFDQTPIYNSALIVS